MTEKYVLVEHLSAINTVIHNIFQSTQRIKFTSFDVSAKYIIFGANSGGIYIFSRESCQFIKLIPSTHGPVNLLSISEDENDLVVAVSSGLVVVLEDCFSANFIQQIFTEHEGNTVTALKWNGNDLFCGDSTGKVSVITLKNFLTKAMFQAPVACLMHLDSQIVQLDAHAKFLLVSTLTRTLLCDTETERYRQIGKKGREGRFGACFFNVADSVVNSGALPPTRGAFQTVGENEKLSPSRIDDNVKIYCARPGARLWQADFQADVIFTHQFRPSLNVKQSDIIYWDDAAEAELKIIKFDDDVKVGDSFNFGKIFTLVNKFILTFREDGFYVFEPSSSALIFWKRLQSVKDVKIVNSSLYIWHRDLEVSIMSLFSVEELILKSLFKKQYTLCGQLCVEFFKEVQEMIATSKKIHLISALESKLDDRELLDKLSPIMQILKDCTKALSLEKYKNGIVSVNNIASIKPPEIPETSETKPKKKQPLDVLLEQYKINKLHKNIETAEFTKLIKSSSPEDFYKLISNFSLRLMHENCDSWCKEMYLKYLIITENCNIEQSEALNFACLAFQEINQSQEMACECNMPLPKAHKNEPKYYGIGCSLMEKSHDYETFQKKVPYMNRFSLEKMENMEEIQSKLSLLIQFSDSKIIKQLSSKMPYDVWDDSIRLLLKLKTGHCLNCGKEIDISESFEWTDFGLLVIESIKPANTLKLFKRHANLLPKGSLDQFFYQYCIFSSISGTNESVFKEIDDSVKTQLEASVGGYLRKTYLTGSDYDPSLGYKPSDMVPDCDHCQLPLRMPLVEETRMLNCGHKYHQVCFLHNKKHCTVCDRVE